MTTISQSVTRTIIDDFAKEIRKKTITTAKPSTCVINFRDEAVNGDERPVVKVPINILRFRKNNGRIASDILDYECNVELLNESDDRTQEVLRDYLKRKDPEKTEVLKKSIMHSGQREPAIITCDGFLINGNRRKMVMDQLDDEHPEKGEYSFMKVVVLPGESDPGGPPTLLEIERLENRYQLQSDGKSEYYGFDRALSIKRKIDVGLSLEDQIRDDPAYIGATKKEIDKAVREHKKEYLKPLECAERYLRQFGRERQYRTISKGPYDKEGRWQALKDYSIIHKRYLSNPKFRAEKQIEDEIIGDIEEAAFDMIRLRVIPGLPKIHSVMRKLHKYCTTKDGKKEILKIAVEVNPLLGDEEMFDENNNLLSTKEVDAKWAAANQETIIRHARNADKSLSSLQAKETPIGLLEAAYKKLTHADLDISAIAIGDYGKAMKIAAKVKEKADGIESDIYQNMKKLKKLGQKF